MPDQNQTNQTKNPVSVISPQADLPPMPPAFQNVAAPTPTASGAPAETTTPPPPSPQPVISMPKKKFGGGRIIATILGLLLLVGGVGAGYVLTQQPQLFQQRASGDECGNACVSGCIQGGTSSSLCVSQCRCGGGNTCQNGFCKPPVNSGGSGGGGGGSQECQPNTSHTISCTTSTGCTNATQVVYCDSTGHYSGAQGVCQPKAGECPESCSQTQTWSASQNTCINKAAAVACSGSCVPTFPECLAAGGTGAGTGSCSGGQYCCNNTTGGPGGSAPTGLGNGATCQTNGNCANGYTCVTGKCTPNTNASCKTGDTGAPVCCTAGNTAASCTSAGGTVACEGGQGGGRLECNVKGTYCTLEVNSTQCGGGGGGGTTTTTNSTAQCSSVLAYDSSWNQLSSSQLSTLAAGTNISFCVAGTTTGGGFDMAKFTINTVAQADTTTKGQKGAASSFCQSYSIPANTSSFNVTAQIHDTTLGWSN